MSCERTSRDAIFSWASGFENHVWVPFQKEDDMIRYYIVLAVAAASCFGILPSAQGESTTTLQITIFEPTPTITNSDVIWFRAQTLENIFPDPGQAYSSSFFVEGSDVQWNIFSEWTHSPMPMAAPLSYEKNLEQLPAGTYQLTAMWTPIGNELPAWCPSSGVGTLSFTVVPEPSTTATLFAAAFVAIGWAGRRTL